MTTGVSMYCKLLSNYNQTRNSSETCTMNHSKKHVNWRLCTEGFTSKHADRSAAKEESFL